MFRTALAGRCDARPELPGQPLPLEVHVPSLVSRGGAALVDATRDLVFDAAAVDAFVHGEAGFVKQLRTLLRVDRGVAKEQLSVSGYWRAGATEDGWRDGKAEWNRQAEALEIAAGLTP